ncbi:MAG TPA: glycosyltransferase family 2 protein [Thermoflexia bacterium]|nr:glycosyltransferase family 2 protein [Thermoflexia bacterium]
MENPSLDLSIVMPVYNEAGNLPVLHAELKAVLDRLGRSYEILAVDDGSTDGSLEVLRRLQREDPHLRIIRFRRNFGQTAAFAAGFDHARGRVVITIDADGQNDPADIPRLLKVMEEGDYDIVSGWRQDRKEPFITRRLPSIVANRIISRTTGVRLHDYGCSLKAYRAEVVKNVHLYGELHRFIPALAGWMGVRVAEVPVNDRPRAYGKSKYGISRTIRVLLDLFTVTYLLSFSSRPMQLFGLIGLGLGGLGGLVGLYLVGAKIAHGILEGAEGFRAYRIGTSPWLMLSVLLTVLGVQFIVMGLLGEVITRTYHEAQDKPIYAIREIIEPEEGE